jgi:hypothetical protein
MTDVIFIYSLIKSLYEESKDFLDVFVPFVVISFPDGQEACNIDAISKNLEKKFNFNIPEHALNTIITRATRTHYIQRYQKKCLLTEQGRKLILDIKSKQGEIEREVNALLEDIREFINEKFSPTLNSEDVKEMLNSFIKKQKMPLLTFFNPKLIEAEWKEEDNKNEYYLIEYFKLAKKQKPNEFKTLEKIFYGVLISTIINKEDIITINKKFNKLQIFFDTNFMFSIMDLHYPHICKPAKELFDLLKTNNKFQLKVFDFTVGEMVRVLNGYLKEKDKYFPNIKVNSIYSNLKSKGWTKQDLIQFIAKVEQEISKIGVQIEYTAIDLNKWDATDKEIYSRLSYYKPEQPIMGQKHDICAIYKIIELRKRPQREIENCYALFLTSDLKLTKFDYNEFGHRDNSTVIEVISDRFLTTLLWLKNPKTVKDLPLETIVSLHSEVLIDRTIWNRFYENLVNLKKKERISEEDVATLIYYHQLEHDLAIVDNPDEIEEDFVLKEIEKSRLKIDEKIRKEARGKIEEGKKKLEEEYKEKLTQKEEEYLKHIESIKENIKGESTKKASVYAILILCIPVALLLLGIMLLRVNIMGKLLTIIGGVGSIFSILQFFGIRLSIFEFKKKLTDCIFNNIYMKRLSKLKIKEIK